jgi:hypothetical protein
MVKVALANLGKGGNGIPSPCAEAEAEFVIVGTLSSRDERTYRPSDDVSELFLLHRRSVHLSPGQVERIAFQQPSASTESVVFATLIEPRFAHCFSQSAVTVTTPDGLLGFVGESPQRQVMAGAHLDSVFPGPGKQGECFPCAPVCACGTRD